MPDPLAAAVCGGARTAAASALRFLRRARNSRGGPSRFWKTGPIGSAERRTLSGIRLSHRRRTGSYEAVGGDGVRIWRLGMIGSELRRVAFGPTIDGWTGELPRREANPSRGDVDYGW